MNTLSQWLTESGVRLTPHQRASHTHVIGQPGTGKSRTLESWIMQDILSGQGVAVIDPHGDLYEHLLLRIASVLPKYPKLAERVILIDPTNPMWTVGFNPLKPIPGIPQERLAGFLTDVIVKIWKLEASAAPRMLRLLTFTFLALSEAGLSLVELPRFLNDAEFRAARIAHTRYRDVAEYFRYEFPQKASAIHPWVTPVLNKIGPLLFDPDVRLMLTTHATLQFREILDQKRIVLVNLPKGILGEGNSALLGAFMVAHLQQAALSRANSRVREPFFLYLDEFQNYTTDNLQEILSESRKYGLSLIMAHQYLDQLAPELREAVLNTAGTLACFRVGYRDATILAHEVFPAPALGESRTAFGFVRVGRYSMPVTTTERTAVTQEALVARLTQLPPREFWARRRGPFVPARHRSLDMPEPALSQALLRSRKHLIDTSGTVYGRLKAVVRQEVHYERNESSPSNPTPTGYYETL